MHQGGSDDADRRAASSYREGVCPFDGWSAEFAETCTGPDGHVVVPTTLTQPTSGALRRSTSWTPRRLESSRPWVLLSGYSRAVGSSGPTRPDPEQPASTRPSRRVRDRRPSPCRESDVERADSQSAARKLPPVAARTVSVQDSRCIAEALAPCRHRPPRPCSRGRLRVLL